MSGGLWPYIHGVPAAGHIAGGFWHPGGIGGCAKCAPAPPRVDPRMVRNGDTITYASLQGRRELAGTVVRTTRDAVHVTRDGHSDAVAWHRVTGHTVREIPRG